MVRELKIGRHTINDDSDCYVIAEIGHNHQGSLETAMEMLSAAQQCGANAAKLQKRDNRALFTREQYDKPYDNENSFGATYGEHREHLEFGREEYAALAAYAREIGIDFFATAFDFASADFLDALDVPAIKIASGDLKNVPLLKHVAALQRPMIISTGGGTPADIERAYDAVRPINSRVCILQCTASYPAAFDELNLRVISTLRERFPDVVIGFSSHDNGIAMPVAAFVLGARVVEKHVTLDRAWKGTDHAFSLERPGLRRMVRDLRNARTALGDGLKRNYESEAAPLYKMGKKLVAARALPTGHRLSADDVAIKSPDDGLPPYELENVVGRVLTCSLQQDDNLRWEDLAQASDVTESAGDRRAT
jgi:N-acetylneuraminate synthase/sialic acid synthase